MSDLPFSFNATVHVRLEDLDVEVFDGRRVSLRIGRRVSDLSAIHIFVGDCDADAVLQALDHWAHLIRTQLGQEGGGS